MWLFLWDSEPSKIFVGDTPISKVFLWDTKVRPSGWWGWQPTEHTLLYIPMDTTSWTTDQSQHQRTYVSTTWLTLDTTTFAGVECYRIQNWYIDLWTSATSWLIPSSKEFTALFRVYCNTAIGGQNQYILIYNWAVMGEYNISLWWMPLAWWWYPNWTVMNWWDSWSSDNWAIQWTCWTQAWHLVSFTVKNGVVTLYKDAVKDVDTTNVWFTLPNDWFGLWHETSQQWIKIFSSRNGYDRLDGYVWQVVFEDVGRADQQIADYYNQFKWNYWL